MEGYNDDDKDSSTPLDLLLNAITDRNDYDPSSLANSFGGMGEGEGTLGGGDMMDLSGLLKQSGYDLSNIDEPTLRNIPGSSSAVAINPSAGRISDAYMVRFNTRLTLDMAKQRSAPGIESAAAALEGESASMLSTIQVWHPTAAQKSYGKEKRLLAPPPFVRASGPITHQISSMTLSAIPSASASASDSIPSSSQTHHIAAGPSQSDPLASPATTPAGIPPFQDKKTRSQESRRLFKEAASRSGFGATLPNERTRGGAKDRAMLRDGISFPGLWIGQEGGKKEKEFRLVLDVRVNEESGQGTATEQLPDSANRADGTETTSTAVNEGVSQDQTADQAITIPHVVADPIMSPSLPPPWTTFTSSPLSIVSKPSIKTAKSRSVSSCLSETASFALWVRINAQTVRTKYMKLDETPDGSARLTSKTGKWTPFQFDIIRRAELIDPTSSSRVQSGGVMTYGSIVRLVDLQSGTKSEPVKIVKVEKNESLISGEDGQPISELQRIGLIRVDDTGAESLDGGKRVYLSAPGARLGGGELRDPSEQRLVWIGRNRKAPKSTSGVPATQDITMVQDPISGSPDIPGTLEEAGLTILDETELDDAFGLSNPDITLPTDNNQPESDEERPKKRLKTKRNALAAAVLQEDDPGADQTVCTWAAAERREVNKEEKTGKEVVGRRVEVDVVDDWMSWVIAGVDNFRHTFSTISAEALPSISPSPRLLLDPLFHPSQNTLQLTLSSFFTKTFSPSRPIPMQVYLGPIGPLPASTFRSVCSKDNAKDAAVPAMAFDGEVTSVQSAQTELEQVYSSFPASVPHVVVLVKMPNPAETLRTMQLLQVQAGIVKTKSAERVPEKEPIAGSSLGTSEDEVTHSPVQQVDIAANKENPTNWIDTLGDLAAEDDVNNEAIRQALESVSKEHVDDGPYGDAATSTIDPTLQRSDDQTRLVSMSAGPPTSLSSVNLIRPETDIPNDQAGTGTTKTNVSGMVSLPILLVNREGGVVFGLGRSVVAERRGGDEGNWGLRVVRNG